MLPSNLHKQLFPQEQTKTELDSSNVAKALVSARIALAKGHLSDHGLLGKNLDPLPNLQLQLPPLVGLGNNQTSHSIEEHFYVLGMEQSEPYLSEAHKLTSQKLSAMPKEWVKQPGWTRYDQDGVARPVPHPTEGEALVFDVEVLYSQTHYPALAVAASCTAWYSWCSSALFDGSDQFSDLVPMGDGEEPRLIVGHSITYDRARILEEYELKPTRNAFIDTMSLHCAVSGMSTQQRMTWKKFSKARSEAEQALVEQTESPEGIDPSKNSDSSPGHDAKLRKSTILNKNRWLDTTSSNSLIEVAKLHLKRTVDKSVRDWFGDGATLEMFNDPVKFQKMMAYCANDVLITHELFRILFPKYLAKCPHPVSFSGMLQMAKPYLTVSNEWQSFLDRCEALCNSYQSEIEASFAALAEQALKKFADGSYANDPWLRHLDWTVKAVKMTAPKISKTGEILVPSRPYKRSADANLIGAPQWYRDVWSKTKQRAVITTSKRIAPYLLRLRWNGHPISYDDEFGWIYMRSAADCRDDATAQRLRLKINKDTALSSAELPESTDAEYWYFRIPHPDGETVNCGNPLAKSYAAAFESKVLTSEYAEAQTIIDLHTQCTYWISSRARFTSQFVVPVGRLSASSGESQPSSNNRNGVAVILPALIPMGTITRRAVEPTWMTVSNAKTTRIGSEIKTLVVPPAGYSFVGADVDSEELWIASIFGDAQIGHHGSTAIGFMTLQGTKAAATDLHSVTGRILGISRDQSKVFNYGRIYGAGLQYAVELLLQSNPAMSRDEAQQKAQKLYQQTKGSRLPSSKTSPINKMWINWVVQSSGVDYLHLLLVSMSYLMRRLNIEGRLLISIHDEIRYIVKSEQAELASLALQISNIWVRALFSSRLGIHDIPLNVSFFSLVDVDHCLRKEVDMKCITPTKKEPTKPGRSLSVSETIESLKSMLSSAAPYGSELPSISETIARLRDKNQAIPKMPRIIGPTDIELLRAQFASDPKTVSQIMSRMKQRK
eukprot:jgi/Hompol1/7089/HPOL_005187-RA